MRPSTCILYAQYGGQGCAGRHSTAPVADTRGWHPWATMYWRMVETYMSSWYHRSGERAGTIETAPHCLHVLTPATSARHSTNPRRHPTALLGGWHGAAEAGGGVGGGGGGGAAEQTAPGGWHGALFRICCKDINSLRCSDN